jgi:hypothetical protein
MFTDYRMTLFRIAEEPLMARCTWYYLIKFLSDLWQVGGFLRVHQIIEIKKKRQ